jgi:hypothetical protein
MQFLSKPPMSRKIRPPRVITHTVFEISPITKCDDYADEETPVPSEPIVDVSKHVMMDCLFEAISQHSACQLQYAHPPNMVDMKMHVCENVVEMEAQIDEPTAVVAIHLSGLLRFPETNVETDSNERVFSLKPIHHPPLSAILNELYSTVPDTSIPRPLSMIPSYQVNVHKLLSVFHSLNSAPIESVYRANSVIREIDVSKFNTIASMLRVAQFVPEMNTPLFSGGVDMMKYRESGVFDMVERVNQPIEERHRCKEWTHAIRAVDSAKLAALFSRTNADDLDDDERELFMEIYPAREGLIQLLDTINSYSPAETRDDDARIFHIGTSIPMKLVDMIRSLESEPSEPTPTYGKATAKIGNIRDMMTEILPNTYSETDDTINMVDKMGVTPLPTGISHSDDIAAEYSSPSIPFRYIPISFESSRPDGKYKVGPNIADMYSFYRRAEYSPTEKTAPESDVSAANSISPSSIMHIPFTLPSTSNESADNSSGQKTRIQYPTSIPVPVPVSLRGETANNTPYSVKTPVKKYPTSIPVSVPVSLRQPTVDKVPDSKKILAPTPISIPVAMAMAEKKIVSPPSLILSLTTTKIRVKRFFDIVDQLEEIQGVYRVIINLCKTYKRMGCDLSEDEIDSIRNSEVIRRLNATNARDKYVVRVTEDFGPITKMTGGMDYMVDTKSVFYKLIVIDDDTVYTNGCLSILESQKAPNLIVSGSGFLFYHSLEYTMANCSIPTVSVDVVEGFAGICFDYSDINKRLMQFIRYYRTIDWQGGEDNDVNSLLKACFVGDDFVISYFYQKDSYHLRKVNGLLGSMHQSDFGFLEDALHRNPYFKSNMGTYVHIYKHLDILDTFLCKMDVCRRIVYKTNL